MDEADYELRPRVLEMTIAEAIDHLIRLRDRSLLYNGRTRVTIQVEGDCVRIPKRPSETLRRQEQGRVVLPDGEEDGRGLLRSSALLEQESRERQLRADAASSLSAERTRIAPLDLPWPAQRARAMAIGGGEDAHWRELVDLLRSPSYEVRRLTASAMKKRMEREPDLASFYVRPLIDAVKIESYRQAQQYMLSALKAGARGIDKETRAYLADVARDATLALYLREAANGALAAAQKYGQLKESLHRHWCHRCKRPVTKEESARAITRYGKPYCQHCLDERILEDATFDRDVEAAKRRRTTDGVAVQSRGEERIANELVRLGIDYEYDARYRIVEGTTIRPDFYLREFDLYIEYWGMNTPEYRANRAKKLELYQRAGKKLISLSCEDDPWLEERLRKKLRLSPEMRG